jgi:trimethylamine--corrinoid protein Co-methyltransferase
MDTNKAPHQQLGLSSSLYRPLDEQAVAKMAQASFEVLERSGVAVYSTPAREAMLQAGAEAVDGTPHLRLPRSMVEDAIDSNPSSITLHSRDGQNDCILEGSKVHYGTGGTAIYVLDPETGERRPSQTRDVILNARMVQQLENIHLFTINVFPNDIKAKDEIDVNRFFHALNHTTKHVMGGIYSLEGCNKAIAMAEEIAGSPDALRAKPFVSFITLIISPFKIDDIYGDMTCLLAENNLPVVVPTEPICGTTSPITLAGNVLTHTAETLAGIVLVQSVRKGAPGICGGVGSIPDLHTMGHLGGPIERGMINAAVSQMAQHFKIPVYSTAGTSDSKAVDVQAAYESAMSSLLVAMSGANYIHDIAGLMEADLTVAYEKLVIDNEILGMCQRVLRGIEVNDETLATDLIIRKGPAEDFLAEEHTLDHLRTEFFMPALANRDKRDQMTEGSDALGRARKIVDEIRNAPAKALLDPAMQESLRAKYPEIRPGE